MPNLPDEPTITPAGRALFDKELEALDVTIKEQDRVRVGSSLSKARKQERKDPWQLFIRKMRVLHPQSWGSKVQNYLADFYGWEPVPQILGRGDIKTTAGDYCEVKVTMITGSNHKVNFVQARQHQNIAGYRLFVIDEHYKVFRFDLTKAQMASEISSIGQSAHGTKAAVSGNANPEKAVRISWAASNADKTRWLSNYLVQSTSEVTPDQMDHYYYEDAQRLRHKLNVQGLP